MSTHPKPMLPLLGAVHDTLRPLAWPVVRMTTGLLLVPHGAQKLFGWFGGGGLDAAGQSFAGMGLQPGLLFALLVGLLEFFGGLMLAVGLLTRPVAALVAIQMAYATVVVHLPNGFFARDGGLEFTLMWGLLALAIVFRGAGPFSVDAAIGREF